MTKTINPNEGNGHELGPKDSSTLEERIYKIAERLAAIDPMELARRVTEEGLSLQLARELGDAHLPEDSDELLDDWDDVVECNDEAEQQMLPTGK